MVIIEAGGLIGILVQIYTLSTSLQLYYAFLSCSVERANDGLEIDFIVLDYSLTFLNEKSLNPPKKITILSSVAIYF